MNPNANSIQEKTPAPSITGDYNLVTSPVKPAITNTFKRLSGLVILSPCFTNAAIHGLRGCERNQIKSGKRDGKRA